MRGNAGRPSAPGDLEAIRRQLQVASADLYRQLALYQQVLRSVLPRCVDQACFHLVTQVHPNRYRALPALRRALLHQRLVTLVTRSSSLLTVEQLIHLADQMGQERRRERQQQQQLLLERLGGGDRGVGPGVDDPLASEEEQDLPDSPPLSAPAGSVHLGIDPPLSGDWLGWVSALRNDPWPLPPRSEEEADPESDEEDFDPDDLVGDREPDPAGISAEPGAGPHPSLEPSPGMAAASPLDQAVAEALAEGGGVSELAALLEGAAQATESRRSLFRPQAGGGLLPTDPIALLAWLEGYERALARRLRNLSHALNGELLRAGLSPILLPLNLLDAVLAGQVESQGGPANILRLQLPMALSPAHGPLQAQVILLRSEDLELEQPPLRTVRRRLQQRRQEIRRMAHTYLRLQRRLQAREAEALWQQDIRTLRNPSEGTSPPL